MLVDSTLLKISVQELNLTDQEFDCLVDSIEEIAFGVVNSLFDEVSDSDPNQ